MIVGYARTSTADQIAGFEAQLRELEYAGCEKVFKEQVSSVAQRGELERALDYVRDVDTFVVTKLDRLARNTQHLLEIIDRLEVKGVPLRILNFGGSEVDTRSATGKLTLTMFAAMAQFEREMMLERQREGIAKAKAAGKYKGRAPVSKVKVKKIHALAEEGKAPLDIAKELSLGRSTVYRILKAA